VDAPSHDPPPALAGCPKRMVYGPCGGVRSDLSCEMAPVPCPFAAGAPVPVSYVPSSSPPSGPDPSGSPPAGPPPAAGGALLVTARRRPVVLTDFTVRPYDPASISRVTGILRGSCDALLVGEHQGRPDFPPSLLTSLITAAGGRPWITLTGRDRNRLVLEQELAGLLQAGADGVLCVTGDGRAPGMRTDVTQVFDLDGTRLAAMAAATGLCVAVAESPAAPPVALRAGRLLQKERAGARLGVLNHVAGAAALRTFAGNARLAGVSLPLIAAVAVYTDERSAAVLQAFPGLQLDNRSVAAVLAARDPVAAGIAAAVAQARELLAIDGVAGVNLSGLASARDEIYAAEVKAAIGRQLAGGASL